MKRREFVKKTAGVLGLPLAMRAPLAIAGNTENKQVSKTTVQNKQKTQKPNIVLILLDDLGWHDVGYHHGDIKTPNIDQLAKQGVRFERMYTFPICTPTRAALMTGRSPIRTGYGYGGGFPWDKKGLPMDERTLGQTMKDGGYFTSIIGKWHLGQAYKAQFPTERGFDHFYGFLGGINDYFTRRFGDPIWNKEQGGGVWSSTGGIDWQRNGKTIEEEGYTTDLLANEAVGLIEKHDTNAPLFLYLPFNAPHLPLEAPEELIKKYEHIPTKIRRFYTAMVDSVDTAIGRIMEALKKKGLFDNTLVWAILSDNGGYPGHGGDNTPLRGRKGTTYEGGLLAPTIMRWPGHLPTGTVSQQVLSVMDVLPTLAGIAGVSPGNTKYLDGKNMWPAIKSGKIEPREDIFFSVDDPGGLDMEKPQLVTRLAVLHGKWKLVRLVCEDGTIINSLFQIEQDSCEKNDLAAKYPELVQHLVKRIEQYQQLQPPGAFRWSGWSQPKDWKSPEDWAHAAK